MECKKDANLKNCTCTYPGCPRKGLCCECVAHHVKKRQLPACFFDEDTETTFDRSFEAFAQMLEKG
ncbi:cytosolic protein [Candidatus Woesearchaeota archaeon]|nr:cytosolic protein [Candidatus Woesearchaeota archaeon]